jgi:carbon monoxide dehydrogenase subunit G
MDMTGEYRIPAPRQQVWEALNDPEVLRAVIPGCEALTQTTPTNLEAKVKAKVGPVSASFTGKVTLSELNPPESYVISGEGSGGVAGFAKGGAKVVLTEDGPDATVLRYEAKADVGGKLAQIGSRLIQGTAKKMADEFFGNFSRLVVERSGVIAPVAAPAEPIAPPLSAIPMPPSEPATAIPLSPPEPVAAPEPIEAPASLETATAPAASTVPPLPPAPPTPRPAIDQIAPAAPAGLMSKPFTWIVLAVVIVLLLLWRMS